MKVRQCGLRRAQCRTEFLFAFAFLILGSSASFQQSASSSEQNSKGLEIHVQDVQSTSISINHRGRSSAVRVGHQTPMHSKEEVSSGSGMIESTLPLESSFSALLEALNVMQSFYFRLWPGIWPTAIDWTAAVMGTQVSATLSAVSESSGHGSKASTNSNCLDTQETQELENTINQYFTQITSFYHGENAFSLRTQAYDDMLWVVLGWLESVQFIHRHSKLHHLSCSVEPGQSANDNVNTSLWYAQQFIPQFAHRARLFYDLASKGWDTSLCGGGMIWNPYLAPYKNAITNQLFIAASVSMFLHFPGDDNSSPFVEGNLAKAHDIHYLIAAIEAYDWLRGSNMTNHLGLYTDGFHVSSLNSPNCTGKCDLRDEQVYSYNQGVILSGLRGLYTATGNRSYLEDGHQLIRDVISASGWENHESDDPWVRYRWAGLGRGGVMEEACDASGSCSQNGQTFKGIWWHHFTAFCTPIEMHEGGDSNHEEKATTQKNREEIALLHRRSCQSYSEWVKWNAKAAWETRNQEGKFGEWWGTHRWRRSLEVEQLKAEGTDYRNQGVPEDEVWRLGGKGSDGIGYHDFARYAKSSARSGMHNSKLENEDADEDSTTWDPNDRGRGRTVETQSGGLAVVRALYRWEMWYENPNN